MVQLLVHALHAQGRFKNYMPSQVPLVKLNEAPKTFNRNIVEARLQNEKKNV